VSANQDYISGYPIGWGHPPRWESFSTPRQTKHWDICHPYPWKEFRPSKTISIVGGAPATEHSHPNEGEIWVHGNQYDRHLECPVTKIFEIHDDLEKHGPDYPEWLVKQATSKGIQLIVGKGFPLMVKGVTVFPFDQANELMGVHLTSTPAYMMAYAILQGAARIEIYGVDMSVDDFEYFHQQPCMYAWIGYARAKGIEVIIPDESPLFKDKHIEGQGAGDHSLPPFTAKDFESMAKIHSDAMNDINQKISNLETILHTHHGSKQSYERLAKVARSVESGQTIENLASTARIIKTRV